MLDFTAPETLATLAALLAGAALIGMTVWLERRPRDLLKPKLLPTTPLLFIGMLVAVLAVVHLLNLAGLHTGRN